MSKPYPVVVQRPLAQTRKRGPLGLLPRKREAHELPTVSAHEVMVYRVDGKYHLDTGQGRLSDQPVVEASHVSVVDLRRNTPVTVLLPIPSAEASEFTVEVTFVCTVTDPVEIVAEGLTDAGLALRAHLRKHRQIFELGLDHRLKDVNTVRRNASAQVFAYITERPLRLDGMTVELESVQVRTPRCSRTSRSSGAHRSSTMRWPSNGSVRATRWARSASSTSRTWTSASGTTAMARRRPTRPMSCCWSRNAASSRSGRLG